MIFPDVYGIDPLFLQQIVKKIIITLLLGYHPENPFPLHELKISLCKFILTIGEQQQKKIVRRPFILNDFLT